MCGFELCSTSTSYLLSPASWFLSGSWGSHKIYITEMILKCNMCGRWSSFPRLLPWCASPAKGLGSPKPATPFLPRWHHAAGYPTRCAWSSQSRLTFSIITEELCFGFTWTYLVSQLCAVRESVLVISSNMVTNFAALHSGLLAVGHQTQMPAPICGARIIKDHKLKLCGR